MNATAASKQPTQRILSIDIMRGITLFLMLFVNDLYAPGVPEWLTHREADFDGMGLADWVFPGFLFMVGMAVPFAIGSRLKKGQSHATIVFHIFIRTLSLLVIGILMLNTSRVNAEMTGMNANLWAVLMYVFVFLIWNQYEKPKSVIPLVLKAIGFIGLGYLILIFRAGTPDASTWLQTGWWGILGLIGWGYWITSLSYLAVKNSLTKTALLWLFFIGLNILSQTGQLNFLSFIKPVFGVILDGNIPSIVMAGLFFSLLLKKLGFSSIRKFIWISIGLSLATLIAGFVLRHWFIISKIQGTPSWAMICNGISILLFVLLFMVIDVLGKKKWTAVFKPAGQNSLTTYLAPNVLYFLIWSLSFPILVYKASGSPWVVTLGSIAWAFAMIGFAALLARIGVRLKL